MTDHFDIEMSKRKTKIITFIIIMYRAKYEYSYNEKNQFRKQAVITTQSPLDVKVYGSVISGREFGISNLGCTCQSRNVNLRRDFIDILSLLMWLNVHNRNRLSMIYAKLSSVINASATTTCINCKAKYFVRLITSALYQSHCFCQGPEERYLSNLWSDFTIDIGPP